ncbi:MAG: alternate F1F0 ATPase, F1 subunit alpha [Hoeflea sp.]|uniref:alternate F1F0 ATPase, F1 subunit alpha n=1 Tax=Hoeflea sp. TaxID=1940281 RepID=UPI001DEFF215|nr:alternate F1F0 ATPase, F1 subunit alpha [Hoeflea sp.]MBU4529280.1 alternate F1F0 ATPase, F1 subunit alpha [Alphaproteobacteria bacterium]MBU4545447.1 alternate F1F0 ATPase, F1 subunit alpha [Alphaproteobacteria bacterium]MBU4550162.1 alternate F1F0 ATPase, F1 subunit alpha [Alphaproteobacteria bacterium]MBV1723203.1 alternate F1F0 ATPase, F1 subunit alpha [Hoeflea sp.]MBV1782876.1 alternate F1F0 ATPase, F1 subunit alpha [Hoeflea sp.]
MNFDDLHDDLFAPLEDALTRVDPALEMAEIARILSVGSGVAEVAGFTDLHADELLTFSDGVMGIASNISTNGAGVIVLGETHRLRPGDPVRRTGRVVDVPVGAGLIGRVVDALGRPLDGGDAIDVEELLPIEQPAPPIMHRAPVQVPLQTGIKAVDAAIPIGRGQRELILGDRQTGKTAIAVDAILNQKDTGVLSIYCAIGQRTSAVSRVIQSLREGGAMERTIVVVASGEDAPGLQFVAPYAATSMAEHFMAEGRDVLIVYDDLTRHARAYRELSLLLRRPPGREAYPGDIFYIHSRLLERATQLREDHGGGSLTALPVVETQAQNISAYIPTNLISITDGQIYLSPSLFEKGHLPAIDIGTSVSRVGGKVQLPAFRAVAGNLRLMYAQFEELETFARFGTQLDAETRRKLTRGLRVREVLKQREHDHIGVPEQIAALLAATEGLFDDLEPDDVAEAEQTVRKVVRAEAPEICDKIAAGEKLGDADRETLIEVMREALSEAQVEKNDGDA